jgi:non-canonical purine NTP pyrophosphatase (RdgB/HAM1 family)
VTGNSGKVREAVAVMPFLVQHRVSGLPEIQSLDLRQIIVQKLNAACVHVGKKHILIVEDTGLYLNGLNGFPGPLVKFLLESIGSKGIFQLCRARSDFHARAVTMFGIYDPGFQDIHVVSAQVMGTISPPSGSGGFGWDNIFVPEGQVRTFAQMETTELKGRHSMRGRALRKLQKLLFRRYPSLARDH